MLEIAYFIKRASVKTFSLNPFTETNNTLLAISYLHF